MKNVIILHGTGASPDMYWYPYIRNELEKKGYKVSVPSLPNKDKSDINDWLPFALDNCEIDEDTILIGHSAGGPLILSILENMKVKIKQAILVAGFLGLDSSIIQSSYNWDKIKSNVKDIIFINSDNDPWGCDDKEGRKLFEKLGGKQIILNGEAHMGSTSFNQPYKKFPFLLKLIE